jgi:hypothetical protein
MKIIVASTRDISFSSIRRAFDKTSTGFANKDDLINAIYPYKDEIGLVRYLAPDTYYRWVSRLVGHTLDQESIAGGQGSAGNSVDDLKKAILKGDQLPMPYIDCISEGAEGYHRMMAIKQLADEYKIGFVEVPVLIIDRIDLEHRRFLPEEIYYDRLKYIGTRNPELIDKDVLEVIEPYHLIDHEIEACWLLDPGVRQTIMAAVNTRNLAENLVRTKSSNVWAYGVNVKNQKKGIGDVLVQFKGTHGGPADIYMYYDVPIRLYRKLVTAPSKGHFIWKYLRNNFQYSKLTGDKRGKLKNAIN